jgi:hypothetical protein
MKPIKRITSILMFVFFASGFSSAQAEWSLFQSSNGVEIYTKEVVCSPASNDVLAEMIIFKVINKTGNAKNVSWQYDLYYNQQCKTCGKDEYQINFDLNGYQTIEGICHSKQGLPNLYIHKRFVNKITNTEELTGFNLSELTIK